MASVIGTAVAFAVASAVTGAAEHYIVGGNGAETKRHNLAMEQLGKERENWNRERQQRESLKAKTRSEERHAKQTFSDLGVAMREYHEVTGQSLSPLRAEPKLSDFYNPSRERKDAELALVVGGMTVVGLLAYKLR